MDDGILIPALIPGARAGKVAGAVISRIEASEIFIPPIAIARERFGGFVPEHTGPSQASVTLIKAARRRVIWRLGVPLSTHPRTCWVEPSARIRSTSMTTRPWSMTIGTVTASLVVSWAVLRALLWPNAMAGEKIRTTKSRVGPMANPSANRNLDLVDPIRKIVAGLRLPIDRVVCPPGHPTGRGTARIGCHGISGQPSAPSAALRDPSNHGPRDSSYPRIFRLSAVCLSRNWRPKRSALHARSV